VVLVQEELSDMRQLVKDLEQQKEELAKQNANAPTRLPGCSSIVPMDTSSAETGVNVQDFLELSADVEAVRLENANLAEQIVERDLLYSVLRTGLLEARKSVARATRSSGH
jgi:anion-transporting  ArsA/GET3 family ATPase